MTRVSRDRARAPTLFEVEPEPPPRARLCAQVALSLPMSVEFTYSVPDELVSAVTPGVRVAVPFGAKRELGVVVGLAREAAADVQRIKPLARVLDDSPLVGAELLELTRWIARRYACSWGEALHAVLPAALKRERESAKVLMISAALGVGQRELAELEEKHEKQFRLLRTLLELGGPIELREILRRSNLSDAPAKTLAKRGWVKIERVAPAQSELESSRTARPRPERLHAHQAAAIERMCAWVERGESRAFLLEGVTGSGKTEVYLALIERALELGRGAIVLVPEIALTPQTVGWFRERFGQVAVLHSRMTDGQRLAMWRSVQQGEVRVVVGARSAVFAPVERLGVIVVDEEHEPSFKQASTPRYHARDVALERARAAGAVCVLGSATPSLESWCAARAGEIEHLRLPERISGHGLPPIEIVDMRSEALGPSGHKLFSHRMLVLLRETLARGEQAILFQNRRGFAPVLWCSGCKETVRCEHCDVALTWHQRIRRLVCHSCCRELQAPRACPTCGKPGLRYLGAGSERIEHEIAALLPRARVRRMDSDTMKRREDYERTLAAFGTGEIDVLVGTQMIAKGLDFPRVTLVGIVAADAALHLPDFRASERTFQLISQVAGRAGRGELAGRIVVQTLAPEHPAITRAAAHDYEGFALAEVALRAELAYPPSGRLIRVLFEDASEKQAVDAASACAERLRALLAESPLAVLGPAPAPISLARGRHRHHVLIKCPLDAALVERALAALRALADAAPRPRPTIDVDPVGML